MLAVTVVVASLLALAGPASAVRPRTLVSLPHEIRAFARDGPVLAWATAEPNRAGERCGRVTMMSLRTRVRRTFGTFVRPECVRTLRADGVGPPAAFAVGGDRLVWGDDPLTCGNCIPLRLVTASLDDPRVRRLGTYVHLAGGDQVTGLAADGDAIAYGWVAYRRQDEQSDACFDGPDPCVWQRTGGHLLRVVGDQRIRVPGAPPPALLAVGGGRIAVAPAAPSWVQRPSDDREDPQPADDGPVDVLDAASGVGVVSVTPAGRAVALALAQRSLAVLVERPDGSRAIERYAVPGGQLLTTTAVPRRAAREDLDLSDAAAVYRVGRQVRIIDGDGIDRLLAVAASAPIGLSIEGRRVTWAQNTRTRHEIVTAGIAPPAR